MSRDVACAKPDDDLVTAAKLMRDRDVGFLPVCDGEGKAVGTLTDRDIVIRALAADLPNAKLRDVMTAEVISVKPGDEVDRVVQMMVQHEVSRILVCDDGGKPVGVISIGDLAIHDEEEAGETLAEVKEGVEEHP
jgi:CBS domain-containing protein